MTTTNEKLASLDEAIEYLMPEAQEYVEMLAGIRWSTTKDNYGRVLEILSRLQGDTAPLFLIALVRAGYPSDTAHQIVQLMGWPRIVAALIDNEGK